MNRKLFLYGLALAGLLIASAAAPLDADEPIAAEPAVVAAGEQFADPFDAAPAPSYEQPPREIQTTTATEPMASTNSANPSAEPQPVPLADEAAAAEQSPGNSDPAPFAFGLGGPDDWTSPEGLASTLKVLLTLTVVSLAPAVLLMTTCFVRIVVVLGLLRQALGTAQLPSSQVVTSIALFMTALVMWPVWNKVYNDAIVPYTSHEITLEQAWESGVKPVRGFMSAQIERTGNSDDVWLFYSYLPEDTPAPSSYDDVPLVVLLPAFMLSELKTAFLIGFQIYLPFLVVDLVVASVTISMGMVMLPPVLVSLPLKLLLFVLVDGWHLIVGMLLESFQTVM